ncbi:MAG: helix-turn-helix domain-containing protein [Candidatus Riflebacteria bacterium]|nr:helix-turn-helix domain-containing protein [Candidatus Riflebacteria bacterium]
MSENKKEKAPYLEFGQRLQELRNNLGLTRTQLGEKCGVAQSTIVNYEKGTRIPFADTAAKMAAVFDLTVEELLGVANSGIEMKKAEALDSLRSFYGKKGEDQARALIEGAGSLLAGGTLTREQQEDFILEMQKLFIIATEKNRAKHTSKKFEAPDNLIKSKEHLRKVEEIDQKLSDKHTHNAFLDEDEFHD